MELKEKVSSVIDKVRPALQGDGGDIELVDVLAEEKVVLVRLKGACFGCPMSTFTIKGYVEQVMKEEIPEITEVRLVQ
ncbi:NifU family protein [candidate division KSB1 bacterium]|nr:NifU family protein [Candidatus Aminicenantes bacterium]RQW03629.1 MAG: NifU family protein [candidate division KSB1 bacterium]